jgi:hypothetical protein
MPEFSREIAQRSRRARAVVRRGKRVFTMALRDQPACRDRFSTRLSGV